jgi:hypothetical protein
MFWTRSMPRLTRTSEILMTCHDSRSTSMVCSLLILSERTVALSSFADRSARRGMQAALQFLHQYHLPHHQARLLQVEKNLVLL